VLLAELINIWAGIWPDPGIGSVGLEELPEFRSNRLEDGAPVADLRLPEQPGTAVPRRVGALEHPAPFGCCRQADPYRPP
jgi:hypothetical protein